MFILRTSFLSNLESLVILLVLLLSLIFLLLVLLLRLILNLEGAKELRLTFFDEDFYAYLVEGDPNSFKKTMNSFESPFRKEDINSVIMSLLENNTWILSYLPSGCKLVGCKWIFKKKIRSDDTVNKYKARLVAKYFTQQKDIDFFDIYSPVARISYQNPSRSCINSLHVHSPNGC